MERISRGFRIVGASWQVLKADRELLVLPIISFLATALMAATFFFPVAMTMPDDGTVQIQHYLLMGVFYFIATFITVFFNAAVVAAAMIRLNGGDPTLSDGLRAAWSKVGKIAAWSLLTASVGLILRMLEERAGFLGRIVIAIVGAAWAAITFFVVPVLLFEPVEVVPGVKRSASLFRERWGEQFTGNVSIGMAMFLLLLPVLALTFMLFSASALVGIVFGVVAIGLLTSAGSAMSGIFNAALYKYATTGQVAAGFAPDDLSGAFKPKKDAGRGAWS
ncbi:MAG TPA: DUF6159 family protein [Actinomycetota bacterium]|nr:DUF6159 family protein [Actinomycetota bacterium]